MGSDFSGAEVIELGDAQVNSVPTVHRLTLKWGSAKESFIVIWRE